MTIDLGGEGCRGELVARERRGWLAGGDRLALEAHLERCASCRLARDVGRDFDADVAVDVRDAARIQALVEVARRGRRGSFRSTRRARVRAVAAAVALVVCGGSASAAVWLWRRPPPAPAGRATIAAPAPVALAARAPSGARGGVTAAPASAPAIPSVEEASPPPAREEKRTRTAPATSAAALLGLATDARRGGEADRASALYRRLQREFPASPEAMLSRVSLGRLLVDGGSPRAALAQFDGYLARSHGGTLIPEALYGRARAFSRLGDRHAERETWRRLVADYPDSVYAPLGRRRLAEPE